MRDAGVLFADGAPLPFPRAVVDQQQNAGKALDKEKKQRDAAPVVPERLGVDRDGLVASEGAQQ